MCRLDHLENQAKKSKRKKKNQTVMKGNRLMDEINMIEERENEKNLEFQRLPVLWYHYTKWRKNKEQAGENAKERSSQERKTCAEIALTE